MSLKIYGMIALGVGAFVAVDAADTSANYESVQARIIKVETDCYIEAGRTRIVRNGSRDLSYMDCKYAPMVALQHDMKKSDVKRRAKMKFSYRSPVDDSRQIGTYTAKNVKKHEYRNGAKMTVYAHVAKPSKYKVR